MLFINFLGMHLILPLSSLSADQLPIGVKRPLVLRITPIYGLDLEDIHRFFTGKSSSHHQKFCRLGLVSMLPEHGKQHRLCLGQTNGTV